MFSFKRVGVIPYLPTPPQVVAWVKSQLCHFLALPPLHSVESEGFVASDIPGTRDHIVTKFALHKAPKLSM